MIADHGQFSGLKGMTAARHAKNIEREVDKGLAQVAAENRAREAKAKAARKAAREAEAARVKFTADDLADAKMIRDAFGWYEVVKVNKVTVSVVPTRDNWLTDKVRIEQVRRWTE